MQQHVLAPGRLEIDRGELVDVDDLNVRREFEYRHADLLARHRLDHLDVTELRSRRRAVTQALSRWLFERGAAGIAFQSNLDDLPCFALFEGHASIVADGRHVPLTDRPPELIAVSLEFGLTLGS